jgi:hypothetical protein
MIFILPGFKSDYFWVPAPGFHGLTSVESLRVGQAAFMPGINIKHLKYQSNLISYTKNCTILSFG